MEYWHLHNALAKSLEDPMLKDNGMLYTRNDASQNEPLPDGVRYSKEMRDDYLFRACQAILLQGVKGTLGMNRSQASRVLSEMFPSMKRNFRVLFSALGVQPSDMLFIYSVRLICPLKGYLGTTNQYHFDPEHSDELDPNIVTRDVPLVNVDEFSDIVASNSVYNADLVAADSAYGDGQNIELGTRHWLKVGGNHTFHYLQWDKKYGSGDANSNEEGVSLDVEYLPFLLPFYEYQPMTTIYDSNGIPHQEFAKIPFEPVWETTILTKAIGLAHLDSGQLGAAYQAAPYLEKIPVVGG